MADDDIARECDGCHQTPASGGEQNSSLALHGSDGSRDGSREGSMTDESVNTRSSTKRSGRGRGEVACPTNTALLYQWFHCDFSTFHEQPDDEMTPEIMHPIL